MKKMRKVWALFGAGLIIVLGMMAYLMVPGLAVDAKPKDWVGSWKVNISVDIQDATFPGLITFFNDGNMVTDETPSPLETSGHGSWVTNGADKGAYTFVFLIGNTDPGIWLEGTVSGKVEYDPKSDQWTGLFTIVMVDQDGNEAFSDTGSMRATRITPRP